MQILRNVTASLDKVKVPTADGGHVSAFVVSAERLRRDALSDGREAWAVPGTGRRLTLTGETYTGLPMAPGELLVESRRIVNGKEQSGYAVGRWVEREPAGIGPVHGLERT